MVQKNSFKVAEESLKNGGVGVIPTDTLYGLVGSALSKKAVSRIYRLKKRFSKKPLIILISSEKDLRIFGIKINEKTSAFLRKIWPGRVSVLLPCPNKKFYYLHRGSKSLAFRIPKKTKLRSLISKTGPLVAPSANIEGHPPPANIHGAKKYFGDGVDFYISSGTLKSLPSTLVALNNGKIRILRKGAVNIKLKI